jgi:hypothetical protein
MILINAFCFSGMFAIRAASSSISCCSLYENTITDLSLSLSSSESDADLVDLIALFGTGEICVKESLDESADDVGVVLDVLVALKGCSFAVFFKWSSCLMNVGSDIRSGAVEIWKFHVRLCHYSCCWVDVMNMWLH